MIASSHSFPSSPAPKKPLEFPILAEAINCPGGATSRFVVLFHSSTAGTVLFAGPPAPFRKAQCVTALIDVTRADHWRILNPDETISLSNV